MDYVNVLGLIAGIPFDWVVIDYYTSSYSYCSNEYTLTDVFASYDCDGEVDACNSDARCYTPGDTFGFDYCQDECECCASDTIETYMILCSILLGISILSIVSNILCRKFNKGTTRGCVECTLMGSIIFVSTIEFIHVIIFILIISNKTLFSKIFTILLIGLFLILLFLSVNFYQYTKLKMKNDFSEKQNNNPRVHAPTKNINNNNKNNTNNSNSENTSFAAIMGRMEASPVITGGIYDNIDNNNNDMNGDNNSKDAQLTQFLFKNKDECYRAFLKDWSQVAIMVSKLKMSNEQEYEILINQFGFLKSNPQAFFEILKTTLTNDNTMTSELEGMPAPHDHNNNNKDDDLPGYAETYQ